MFKRKQKEAKANRMRDWKGLLGGESRRSRYTVFALLLLVSACMTFTQFGFIGVGPEGDYLGYVLGLLVPITLCALLLGKGAGALQGLLSGLVLLAHARLQPLDLFERYFVSPLNSVALYCFSGFLIGLLFALALRKDPRGIGRIVRFCAIAWFVGLMVTIVFVANTLVDVVFATAQEALALEEAGMLVSGVAIDDLIPHDSLQAISAMGALDVQVLFDQLLVLAVSVACDAVVRRINDMRSYASLRFVFRRRLFVAVFMAFFVVQAVSFTAITRRAEADAAAKMDGEIGFIGSQMTGNARHSQQILESPDVANLSDDLVSRLFDEDVNARFMGGYTLEDGTVVVIRGDEIAYSDNPAYPAGSAARDVMGAYDYARLGRIAETGKMSPMVYVTHGSGTGEGDQPDLLDSGELGYMKAAKDGDFVVMMAMPASMVFANRSSTMRWATLIAATLAVATYVAASLLLRWVVAEPIDRTNDSLAKIGDGDLDEIVSEVGCVEFSMLSAGINATVDSLKGLIGEAERRMERDLATAKAIQESALPRTFPPFPEIEAFDIFASMDAAKEVGGDFYDFFLVDDHTLGFLIADVSGKGIPGALFMMAAKTEIENYLATGMAPAEAIASANRRLCANNDAGMFVTVWAATLEWETGLLTYVNAGHNFPLLRHGSNGAWEWLKKKCGLFLGTFDTAKYRQETLTLEPGDELLLYTDGVNEAFNVAEEEFGNDRLEAFLQAHDYLGPKSLVRRLRAEVAAWAEGAEQSDDITILALEYGAVPDASGFVALPATLDHLGDAMDLISSELERRLCPASIQRKVEVALEELFVNVCNYAYAEDSRPGEVTVSYRYCGDPRSITVELRDQGIPFDPLTLKDPTRPVSIQEAKIGGLGVLMVKRSMDDFTYQRDGIYNVVSFAKRW